jgi:hypothetical protein
LKPQILSLLLSNVLRDVIIDCPGGELFYYLRKIKRMTEDEARYCFI